MQEQAEQTQTRDALTGMKAEALRVGRAPVADLMGGNIPALVAALALAQGQMANPLKDAANDHFGSQYATLGAVLNAIRGPLAENGLALVQLPSSEATRVTVRTILVHKEGGWMMSTVSCQVANAGPQGVGGGVTYLRRYAAAAMCGVAQEDDDGNGAQPQGQGQQQRQQQRSQPPRKVSQQRQERPAPKPAPTPARELPPIPEELKKAPAAPATLGKLEKRLAHSALSEELRGKVVEAMKKAKAVVHIHPGPEGEPPSFQVADAGRMTEYGAQVMVRDMEEDIRAASAATPAGSGEE